MLFFTFFATGMATLKIFTHGSPEYAQALNLRQRVLREPLGLKFTPEELQKDEADTHMGLFEDKQVMACLTLTFTGNGRVKMRQVAVESHLQGQGLGKQLALAAESYILEQGCNTMYCNARKAAVPFYTALGYQIVSDEFTEVGIPHYTMQKNISL